MSGRRPEQGFEEPDVEAANEAIKSAETVSAFVTIALAQAESRSAFQYAIV